MTADRAQAHATMRKALTAATIACDIAASSPAEDLDDAELYRMLEITLRQAGELLNVVELSVAKACMRSVTA